MATSHATITTKEACDAAKGTWTDAVEAVEAKEAEGDTPAVEAAAAKCEAPAADDTNANAGE